MKTVAFEQVLKQLAGLSHRQRSRLAEALKHVGHDTQAAELIQTHFESAPQCPHCTHEQVHRYGHADGLQRYRCCACAKTFNALTGTPLARLRHKPKWLSFVQQILACVFRPIVTAHSEKGVTGDSEVVTGDSDLIVTDLGRRRNHRSRCRNRRSRSNRNGLCGQRGNHPCHGYPRALCAERRDAGGADCHAQHQGAVTAQVRLRALA